MSSSYIALELASADENKTCVGTCVNTESIFFRGLLWFLGFLFFESAKGNITYNAGSTESPTGQDKDVFPSSYLNFIA